MLVLSLAILTTSCLALAMPMRVVIDPGHGGIDSGASSGSAKESEIALSVSKQLEALLKADPLFAPIMTRDSDKALSLAERVHIAEAEHADLFVSIHVNANRDPRASGIEVYFQNHLPADEETLFLAANENQGPKIESNLEEPTKHNDVSAILDDLRRHHRLLSSHQLSLDLLASWPTENVAIRQAPFFVVSRAPIPSVLIELGFITNPNEAQKLVTASFQKRSAQNIYQGLLQYERKRNSIQGKP